MINMQQVCVCLCHKHLIFVISSFTILQSLFSVESRGLPLTLKMKSERCGNVLQTPSSCSQIDGFPLQQQSNDTEGKIAQKCIIHSAAQRKRRPQWPVSEHFSPEISIFFSSRCIYPLALKRLIFLNGRCRHEQGRDSDNWPVTSRLGLVSESHSETLSTVEKSDKLENKRFRIVVISTLIECVSPTSSISPSVIPVQLIFQSVYE